MVIKSLNFICNSILNFLRYVKCLLILVKQAPKGPRKCEVNKFVEICVTCGLHTGWLARPDLAFAYYFYML